MLELFQWLGIGFVTVIGALGAAWGFFKFFSRRWLENQFAKQLADHQHTLQKELEDVRLELNKLFDRSVKLHQREFETLPHMWGLLVEAFEFTKAVTSPFQRYPSVRGMNEEQLNSFLDSMSLDEFDKQKIKGAEKKDDCLQSIIDWRKTTDAHNKVREFHKYRLKYGIFVTPDLQEKFQKMGDFVFNALSEYQYNLESHEKKD